MARKSRLRFVLMILSLIVALHLCNPFYTYATIARPVHILAFGDSLTAGYGLGPDQAFPRVLEKRLKEKGLFVEVVNAGVSGDTSATGLARLDWALAKPYDIAILELGANDALRGLSPGQMKKNLDAILATMKARGIKVLLAGMYAPSNLGPEYAEAYRLVFKELAAKHGCEFYPFFLEGVAGKTDLNQPDGIHPNVRGVEAIVARMLPLVSRMVKNALENH